MRNIPSNFQEIKLFCEHSLKTFACQTFGKQILCMSITKFYSTLKNVMVVSRGGFRERVNLGSYNLRSTYL